MEAVRQFVVAVPFDWFIVAGFAFIIAIDALRSGIGRAAAITLALPIAIALYGFLPMTAVLSGMSIFSSSNMAARVTLGIIFGATYIMIRRMGIDFFDSGIGEPIQAIIASASATAIVLVFWLSTPALNDLWTVGPQLQALFSEPYRLFWLAGAYAALVFARG